MTMQSQKEKPVTLTMDVMTTAGLAGIFMHLATESSSLLCLTQQDGSTIRAHLLYYMSNSALGYQ
jgi:hypothetical protein